MQKGYGLLVTKPRRSHRTESDRPIQCINRNEAVVCESQGEPVEPYILRCRDGKYYVGKTNDLEDRLHRHNQGQVSFTSSRLPFELVMYLSFDDEWKAAQMEKYLKSGSGRAFAKRHLL
jgi:predicted GIY-YIG superfamily endonuclease